MDASLPSKDRASRTDRSVRRPMTLAIQSLSVATASSLLLWTAGGSFDMPSAKLASAGTKFDKASKQSASGFSPEVQEKTFKLNYFSSPWETVFKDLAEATGSQLIADRVPKGRFSRRDATEYSRHDAVRIINKDIEPLGFRLIEKGDFLVVLDLPSQRPRYQPITITKDDNGEKVSDPNRMSPQSAPSPYERRVDAITVRDDAQAELLRDAAPRRSERRPFRTVSHDDVPAESNGSVSRRVSTADAVAPARLIEEPVARAPQSGSQVVFRPKHRSAVDLSKQVYRTLKPRAQLVSHGPNGLPAFRIASEVASNQDDLKAAGRLANGGPSFTIAIDEASDELLIVGTRAESDATLKLLRTLDRPFDAEEPLQVTATTKYVCQIAHQLPAEIERIRAANQGGGKPATKPAREAEPVVPRGGRQAVPSAIGDAIGTLKGEVAIESVNDLGVLIIRGNEKDVEEVMKVIRELEKLSEATAPQVHLLYLKNVDAESLAELLTTVYERLTQFPGKATQPRQSAAILPITKPNSLLIVAPEADLNAILDLAEELDRPVDPETEFQVFHLKSAIALQVEELITKFYEERKNLGAKVLVTSDSRTNAVIVRAQPRDLDEIEALIKKLERDPVASSSMKIFPLKSALATDLSAVINAAIQSVIAPPTSSSGGGGGGQGALQGLNVGQVDEQFKNVKSAVLKFLVSDKAGDRELQSGVLSDIRITPDARANSLIVSASEQSMALIEELIKQLDKPTSTVSEIKIFMLANADAELMVTQLNALFNGQTQTGGGNQRQAQGLALAGADDASASLVPLKFSVDKRTNSIIAAGAADSLRVVEAILLRLDESDVRARKTRVLRLQNSPAAQVATEITQFYTSQRDLQQNDPNLVSSVEQLEREVIVVADTATNSLMVSATPRYFDDIELMVKQLDTPPRQVVIQALLVEVELANTDEFGIELGFQDSILFNRSTLDAPTIITKTTTAVSGQQTSTQEIISQTGQPGFNFNNPSLPLGNNLKGSGSRPSNVASQGLSNFSLGRVNGDLGFGGLVLSAGSESVNALLRALSAHRRIQILSRPQIRALDNQQAEIFSGQEIPVVSGFTQSGIAGSNVPTIERKNAGIQLTCIPRVTLEGQVFMQVYAQRSQYRNEGVPISTDQAGRTIESPILDISRATTTISVQTGQTVVIGGLINTRDESFTNKVPFLGDLPLIGTAFRYDSRSTRRVELLVFLTPRVINGAMDEEAIKDVEMGRLHYIESEAEDIHGPLRALPAPDQVFDENGAPWNGPGTTVPNGTGPAIPPAPQMVIPPAPKFDGTTSNSLIIHDPAFSPASASRMRFTEEDDQPMKVQQAKAESFSSTRSGSRSPSKATVKPAAKSWGIRK